MRFLLISCIILITGKSYCQTGVSFPDSNASWITEWCEDGFDSLGNYLGCFPYQYEKIVMDNSDTVLLGDTYNKLFEYTSGTYLGAMKDSAGRVFFVPKDSTTSFLMYDFSLSVGDTVEYYEFISLNQILPALSLPHTVQSVDSVLINGQYHKRIYLGPLAWIEGIGTESGLFQSVFYNLSEYQSTLHCMSKNTDTYWPVYQAGIPCAFNVDVEEFSFSTFSIYPNPASNELNVRWSSKDAVFPYRLYSVFGKLVKTGRINNGDSIDLSKISAGQLILLIDNQPYSVVKQ